MKSKIHTRASVEQDFKPLFALYELLFREHIQKIWGWNDDWQQANFKKEWETRINLSIELEGKLIGYIQKKIELNFIYLQNIAIHPEFQGHGIGTDVIRELQSEASNNKSPLKLSVFRTNQRAQKLYERLGFEIHNKTDAFVEMEWNFKNQGEPAAPVND